MKLIIIEGGDRLGKNTIVEGICKSVNYENIAVRHFGKPPKGLTPEEFIDFQFKCFTSEAILTHHIKRRGTTYTKYNYHNEIVIWNRSHLGEYVYSQMFRDGNPEKLKDLLLFFENIHLNVNKLDVGFEVYLITLTAESEFFLSKEDGQSFSQNIEQKTKELELFKEAHGFSLIQNKMLLKVDNDGKFRPKEDILNEIINFINK